MRQCYWHLLAKFFANVPHFFRQTLDFSCVIFHNPLIIKQLCQRKFSQMISFIWEFHTLAKNDAQKWGFLRYKNSVFSQMMQMKWQKNRFAKNIRHRLFRAKIDKRLIINTLAIFRFFANVLGQKVKFLFSLICLKLQHHTIPTENAGKKHELIWLFAHIIVSLHQIEKAWWN